MMDLAWRDLAIAGARIECIAAPTGFAHCVHAAFRYPASSLPGILIMGHLETVHSLGRLTKLPFRRDGARAWALGSAT